jgi:hypothetical protein
VRVNTNGWWGRARNIRISQRLFADADAVIAWLQGAGVVMLALSADRRVTQYPGLWRSVVTVIDHRERRALPTELILTEGSDNPVVRWFAANAAQPIVPAHGLPGRHPCALAVRLARVIDGVSVR